MALSGTPTPSVLLERVFDEVLKKVCTECGFVYGEAFLPGDDGQLRLSGSHFAARDSAADFFKLSMSFQFPAAIGVPGRVWKNQRPEWHRDVSVLPTTIFKRSELARRTGLKCCLGLTVLQSSASMAVLVFFGADEQEERSSFTELVIARANQALSSPSAFLRDVAGNAVVLHIATGANTPQVGPCQVRRKTSRSLSAKFWERCKPALLKESVFYL